MRVVKRIASFALAGALSLSLAVAASAARAPGGGNRGGGVISQVWLSRLNLTADQQTKVKAATDAYRAEAEKARGLSGQERRQATRQARQTYQAAIRAALNADQQKQLDAMIEEARQYRELGPMGNQLVGLNLTDAQKAKIKEITAKYQPDMEKARTASGGRPDRTRMRELTQKIQDEVKAVLTPEQQKLMLTEGERRAG